MSSTLTESPGGMPLGGATVSGTQITVDTYVNPPTRIPEIVRNLVADNEGYFAEDIFSVPGFTVEGGAIIYTPTFPTDLFLDPDKSLAPRAPGSEAPLIGSKRYEPLVARPESIAGRIEVHDEARRRNLVFVVQNDFQKAANTFADRLQSRAIETLNDFIDATSRSTPGLNWRAAHTSGLGAVDPATLPRRDFATVLAQFIADKAGVRPDTIILNQEDALYLEETSEGSPFAQPGQFQRMLDRYGIKNYRVSPQQPEGRATFVKSKQVGVIAFEKPLDQEYERAGTRKTDVYILEMTPVFVAYDAAAVFALDGIDS
jgi:hypothetical protein